MSILNKYIGWNSISIIVKSLPQIIIMLTLSRTLSFDELGVISILSVVTGFAMIFCNLGFSAAIIYSENLEIVVENTLKFINIMSGILVSISIVVLSDVISSFYDSDLIGYYLIILSPIFMIRAFSIHGNAILQKRLDFDKLAKIDIVSNSIALILFFTSSYIYNGLISFVVFNITLTVIYTWMTIRISSSYSFNLINIDIKQSLPSIKYGMYISGENLLTHFSSNFDVLIIGKVLGTHVSGPYSYIKEILLKPALQVINAVVNRLLFPLLCKVRNSNDLLRSTYVFCSRATTLINTFIYLLLFVFSEYFVTTIFSNDWSQYSHLFSIISLYVLCLSIINPMGSLVKATGYVKRSFIWNIFNLILRTSFVFVSVIVFKELESVAYSLLFASIILLFLHIVLFLKPILRVSITDWLIFMADILIVFFVTLTMSAKIRPDLSSCMMEISLYWLLLGCGVVLIRIIKESRTITEYL
ncbi:oligosaccharide flippase family protein [Vibrio mytili]|uniref:oligosaccharide flippase family protein n=1 Tax=Vibrio mytili TaxID=50718 RepID=UPI003C6F6230